MIEFCAAYEPFCGLEPSIGDRIATIGCVGIKKRILCIRLLLGPSQPWIERCGRFSPTVGLEPTDDRSILLDITGLAHLFGGEAALCQSVVRDFARLGQTIHAAAADTIGAAWAITKAADHGPLSIRERARVRASCDRSRVPWVSEAYPCDTIGNLRHTSTLCLPKAPSHEVFCNKNTILIPPGAIPAALGPLPIEMLRLPDDTVRLLHELGITRIEQVEQLPRNELSSRFGPVLLMRLDQAFGRLDEPVHACPIPPIFEADWSAEHPTTRRETIEAAVEHLIHRVAAMLTLCGRGALRLECHLRFEIHDPQSDHENLPLSIGLFQPTAAADHLYQLVQLQLERLRIPSPITDISVAATLTSPLEPRKQAVLFDVADDPRRQHSRHLATLVERISSRLGCQAILGVRLRPEAQPELSWHYDPLVDSRRRRRPRKTLPIQLPPRPLRLLSRPLPLAITSEGGSQNTQFVGTQIVSFRFAGQQHQIAHTLGPERIETGWWRGRPIGRDYFRVETTTGQRFWLFCRLRDEKWFLQGVFE